MYSYDLHTGITERFNQCHLAKKLNTPSKNVGGLFLGTTKILYKRYVLLKNKPKDLSFKNVLDNKTGLIEKHNYITFAEKTGKESSRVRFFMSGLGNSFMKKRYVLVD